MAKWSELAHFLYGRGFWYADPLREIRGLTEEQLFWQPEPDAFCILWHVGHIAHRERTHIGMFLEGLPAAVYPPEYDVFGVEWRSLEQLRGSIGSVEDVLGWVREVRAGSHEYIDTLSPDDLQAVPPGSPEGLSAAHWLFITTAHTAVHLGKIQLLRTLNEGGRESPC